MEEKESSGAGISMIPVVIPAYEPDQRLLDLLDDFAVKGITDVVLVDDGSGEEYRRIFQGALDRISPFRGVLLSHEVNRGKGRALKTAFAYILEHYPDAEGVVTADSDGQHTVECIRAVMKRLTEEKDALVMGVRTFDGENVPWKSALGNKLTMKILGYVSGVHVSDTQTGLRGIPCAFMKELLEVPGERFEFETQMLLAAAGKVRITEVPIQTIYDSKENHQTHFNPVRDSIRIYRILGARFAKFLFASVSSSAIDLVLFTLFCHLLRGRTQGMPGVLKSVPYVAAATVLARVLSAAYNFAMNYRVVFQSSGKVSRSAARYVLLALIQMALSALLVTGGTALLPVVPEVAVKAVIDTILFLISFYIQRRYVF